LVRTYFYARVLLSDLVNSCNLVDPREKPQCLHSDAKEDATLTRKKTKGLSPCNDVSTAIAPLLGHENLEHNRNKKTNQE
jgi:hypothetical protein